jgi:hypothetical protein
VGKAAGTDVGCNSTFRVLTTLADRPSTEFACRLYPLFRSSNRGRSGNSRSRQMIHGEGYEDRAFQGRLGIHGRIQKDDQRTKIDLDLQLKLPSPLPLCPRLRLPQRTRHVKTRPVSALRPQAQTTSRFCRRVLRSRSTTASLSTSLRNSPSTIRRNTSFTTADVDHVAPGATGTDAFSSFLEADIPKDGARH